MIWPGHTHKIIYFYPAKQCGYIQNTDWEQLLALANPKTMPENCLWQGWLAQAKSKAEPVLAI